LVIYLQLGSRYGVRALSFGKDTPNAVAAIFSNTDFYNRININNQVIELIYKIGKSQRKFKRC
jgi:hypothetical protein